MDIAGMKGAILTSLDIGTMVRDFYTEPKEAMEKKKKISYSAVSKRLALCTTIVSSNMLVHY